MIKEELKKEIENILKGLGVVDPVVNFDVPKDEKLGNYSTNVAMVYGKILDRKPYELALDIEGELCPNKNKWNLLKIKSVEPGFLNFYFNKEYFSENLEKILKEKENYGKNQNLSGEKIIIEYTDPNPFKEFHIGHLMSNTIGESVSRIIKASGAELKRACYQGDVGMHVATAVWGLIDTRVSIDTATASNFGQVYAYGVEKSKDEKIKNEIVEINKHIFDRDDDKINKLYDAARKISLEYFEKIYNRLGTHFDYFFFESKAGFFGKEIVEKNIGAIFEKSDGAIIFKGEKYDPKIHTRVFINKEGLPTYEAKELGLAKIKYDLYQYDLSIVVTDSEIREYFKVLLKAMSLIFPNLAEKTIHLPHGMLKLPDGKMSSRSGNVITAEWLIEEVKKKVLQKMQGREDLPRAALGKLSMTVLDSGQMAEIVAIGAIKYSILHQAIGNDIVFDFDKSISFEGDSGPYLQYATVRASSLLARAGLGNLDSNMPRPALAIQDGWQTISLERLLERFPKIVERASLEYAPHHIVTYLIELAGEFNSFYASHKIIDASDPTSPYRLALTEAFANVMTTGLDLLGIKVPDQM